MHPAESFAVPGSTRFRGHEHDGVHICVVLNGGFIEREGKSWRDVAAGTVRVSGGARHDIDFSPRGATCMVLEPEPRSISRLTSPQFIGEDPRLTSLARRISSASRAGGPAGDVLTDDLVTEFLAQIDRRLRGKVQPPPPWLSDIREMLESNTGFPVTSLAEHAGVHRVHVARTFRDHYGVSLSTYARRIRVRRALELLFRDDIPLSELAYTAGFSDQSHLTREIRSATGATPGALRSAQRYIRSRPRPKQPLDWMTTPTIQPR